MYSTKNIQELSSGSILSIVNEYEIFTHYLGEFVVGKTMLSPLRKEKNPSFRIYRAIYGAYKLRYIDFSTREGGTCFDLVMRIYNCNYATALIIINRDMKLSVLNEKTSNIIPYVRPQLPEIKYKKSIIQVGIRPWNSISDKDYWTLFGISGITLKKFNVYPLSHFRINGVQYECRNLTYGYYFGNGLWKLYMPYGNKNERWLSNTNSEVIQGWEQLPLTGDLLIITKSLKDVMLLYELNISAIAPQSEGVLISLEKITELKSRFTTIYLNFDFDYAGITSGNKYRKKYKIKTIYLTNGRFKTTNYKAKDITDFTRMYGKSKTKELINKLHEKQ